MLDSVVPRLPTVNSSDFIDAHDPSLTQLERFGRLAARLLAAPGAVIGVIADPSAPTVAQVGFGDEQADPSFARILCQRVMHIGEPVIVGHTENDQLVASLLAGRPMPIRSYVGVPVRLDGVVVGAVCVVDVQARMWTEHDVATLREIASVAEQVAGGAVASWLMRDTVTGLPSRGLYYAQLRKLRAELPRRSRRMAVAIVSLVEFPLLSDAFGQQGGNTVLAEVARRLSELPVGSGERPRVCRNGVDQFVVAVGLDSHEDPVASLAAAIRHALVDPVVIAGEARQLRTDVAVVTDDDATADEETLVRRACLELARPSHRGRSDDDGAEARRRLTIMDELRGVEARGELRLFYQPIVDLASGQWRGFEALLRWKNGRLGPVSPADFIPTAEATGAIVPIGQWVLEQAIRQIGDWREFRPELDLRVAVNTAPQQLAEARFAERLTGTLAAYGVPGSSLVLEIPGSALKGDTTVVGANLAELRRAGVQISVDDFGGGLVGIGRAVADELKLDRSFVTSLSEEQGRDVPVSAILAMAEQLGLPVVATGIETEAQRRALVDLGCGCGQGYFLARPAPAEAIASVLSSVFEREAA